MKANIKPSKINKLFFILLIHVLLGLQQAYATTYYVSPTGIDTNNGISLSTPVKTIKNALSKAWASGDIVYVLTGTYTETVYIGQNNITLSAYPDNTPIIDGGTTLPNADWGDMIYVVGNSNTVSGFEVKNSNINGTHLGGYGIQVEGHNNTISKMNVHHTWETGILVNGDYNIVEDSKIWQAARHNSTTPHQTVGWATGLSAARNASTSALTPGITSYAIFRRNTVFNNWGEGLSCYEADHCTMEDNIVYDNWATNMYLSDTRNSLVRRNLVYISTSPAITTLNTSCLALADEVSTVPRSANNTISNNFFYNGSLSAFSWTLVTNSGLNNILIANNTIVDGVLSTGGSGQNVVNINSQVRNNVIYGAKSSVPSNNGITFSNNNWAMTPVLAAAVTDIVGDPQIARTGTTTPGTLTSAYFKLLEGSPVIDAATPLANVTDDYFQAARGTLPDMGGDEFSSNASPIVSDTVAPSAPSALSFTVISNTMNLKWNASTDNVSVTGYKIYKGGIEIGTSTVSSYTDTAVAGATYNYTIKAYDAAGNLSASSNIATVNLPQTAVLSITSTSVSSISSTSTKISWTTNISSTGIVSYGTSADNLNYKINAATPGTNQSVSIFRLSRRTKYYYTISAVNGLTNTLSKASSFRK
jgi:hypothetical protein